MTAVPDFAVSVVAEAIRQQPLSPGKVRLAWQMVAGPKLARMADPHLQGTSTICLRAKDQRWAGELERSRAVLVERLKTVLGVPNLTLEVS